MWGAVQAQSDGGWIAPLGDITALAEQLIDAASHLKGVMEKGQNGLAFAKQHAVEDEFDRRIDHLQNILAE